MENELNPQQPKPKRRRRATKPATESKFSESEWSKALEPAPEVEVAKEEPAKAVEPPAPAAEVKPWVKPVRPMKQRKANGPQRGVRKKQR